MSTKVSWDLYSIFDQAKNPLLAVKAILYLSELCRVFATGAGAAVAAAPAAAAFTHASGPDGADAVAFPAFGDAGAREDACSSCRFCWYRSDPAATAAAATAAACRAFQCP